MSALSIRDQFRNYLRNDALLMTHLTDIYPIPGELTKKFGSPPGEAPFAIVEFGMRQFRLGFGPFADYSGPADVRWITVWVFDTQEMGYSHIDRALARMRQIFKVEDAIELTDQETGETLELDELTTADESRDLVDVEWKMPARWVRWKAMQS